MNQNNNSIKSKPNPAVKSKPNPAVKPKLNPVVKPKPSLAVKPKPNPNPNPLRKLNQINPSIILNNYMLNIVIKYIDKITNIYVSLLNNGITNIYAINAILSNIGRECNFNARTENFENYSKTANERIRKIFYSRLGNWSDNELTKLKSDPYKFAESIYGKNTIIGQLFGNLDEGDGYKYCGRGSLQITGKNKYITYSNITGYDLVNNPDIINEPQIDNIILINFIKDNIKITNFNYINQNEANIQITTLVWGNNKDFSKGIGLEGFNRVVEYSKIFESLEYFTNLYKQYKNNIQLENN